MTAMFERVALIGLGLIGSSLCHVIRRKGIAGEIVGHAQSGVTRAKAIELKLADRICVAAADAVQGAVQSTIFAQGPPSKSWQPSQGKDEADIERSP